jgi:hypothetical protein
MKRILGILIASCAAAFTCSPAGATTFSIQPSAVSASPGSSGNAFDVVLTNNGPGSITVGIFAFEVSVTDADVNLTGADFSTGATAYIFAGHSFDQDNSLPLNLPSSGQTLDASDSYDISGSGVTLTSGESLALGEVLYSVSPTAVAGPVTVSFTGTPSVSDGNNLSDPSFNAINVDTFTSGTITITTPEPSSIFLTLAGMAALAALRRRS